MDMIVRNFEITEINNAGIFGFWVNSGNIKFMHLEFYFNVQNIKVVYLNAAIFYFFIKFSS